MTTNPDELFDTGLARLKAGDYWEAHEDWEELWLSLPEDSRAGRATKALIQLAAICYKPEQAAGGRTESQMQRGMDALLNTATAHLTDARQLDDPAPNWRIESLARALDRLESILARWQRGQTLAAIRSDVAEVVDEFAPSPVDDTDEGE